MTSKNENIFLLLQSYNTRMTRLNIGRKQQASQRTRAKRNSLMEVAIQILIAFRSIGLMEITIQILIVFRSISHCSGRHSLALPLSWRSEELQHGYIARNCTNRLSHITDTPHLFDAGSQVTALLRVEVLLSTGGLDRALSICGRRTVRNALWLSGDGRSVPRCVVG